MKHDGGYVDLSDRKQIGSIAPQLPPSVDTTTATTATPPTPAADPMADILTDDNERDFPHFTRVIRSLAARLASAEQAKVDAESRLEKVREARQRSVRIGLKAGGAEDGYRFAALGLFADQVDGILGLGDYAALGADDATREQEDRQSRQT
jgi:hypothetical protein